MQQPPDPLLLHIQSSPNKYLQPSNNTNELDNHKKNIEQKYKGKLFKICILASFSFALLSNRVSYRILEQLYSTFTNTHYHIITMEGIITFKGTFILSIVFFFIMIYLMM